MLRYTIEKAEIPDFDEFFFNRTIAATVGVSCRRD